MYEHSVLHELQAGNQRFVTGDSTVGELPERRQALVGGQQPKAVILGCSDSRVPPEVIFDQGLGDLFVVRVAGNVVGAAQVASIEYAVTELDVPVIVVLGHSDCGAVKASIAALDGGGQAPSDDLAHLIDCIRPAVQPLLDEGESDGQALTRRAVQANIENTVAALGSRSAILEQRVEQGGLLIVGAEYSLESGVVNFG